MPPHPQTLSVPALLAADAPRTLFCCLATPDYYRRPLFSEREVFCGPDCPTVETDNGFASLNPSSPACRRTSVRN